jgi:hypothetical protein
MGMTATEAVGIGTGTAAGVALNIGGNLGIDGTVDGVDVSGAFATLTSDLQSATTTANAHINAVTAVHGAAAGTRFLTASETIDDSQIPAGVARDVELPGNASFTLAGLSEKNFSSLAAKPTTRLGYGLTDVASLGANSFTGDQTITGSATISGKFGVGTGTPQGLADIYSASGNADLFLSVATSAWRIVNVGADKTLRFQHDLSNLVTFTTNGYLGIGTSTPLVSCHISGALSLIPQASPPSYTGEGTIYMDTDHHLYVHNGTGWVQMDN